MAPNSVCFASSEDPDAWVGVLVVPKSMSESAALAALDQLREAGNVAPRDVLVVLSKRMAKVREKATCFAPEEILYDVLAHRDVPVPHVLGPQELSSLMEAAQLGSAAQLPSMKASQLDARAAGLRPGDTVRMVRRTDETGSNTVYRYVTR